MPLIKNIKKLTSPATKKIFLCVGNNRLIINTSLIIDNLKLINYKLPFELSLFNLSFSFSVINLMALLTDSNLRLQVVRQVIPLPKIIIFLGFLIFSHIPQTTGSTDHNFFTSSQTPNKYRIFYPGHSLLFSFWWIIYSSAT